MVMKFKDKLSLVPHKPGSYQMKDKNGNIIYVGKAKDLNKRLSSYFNRIHTGKTGKMVSLIEDFKYIVASSELEAFIIEINLIKELKRFGFGVVITSDCHNKDYIDCNFKESAELLKCCGFKEQYILTKTGFVAVPL